MKFSEYCDIMRTRGIDELYFMYQGIKYNISMYASNFTEYVKHGDMPHFEYCVTILNFDNEYRYDNFDELIQAELFEHKSLQEIWSEIENVYFNALSEYEYLLKYDRLTLLEKLELNKEKYLQEKGVDQWSHSLSAKHSFWRRFPFMLLCAFTVAAFSLIDLFFNAGWIDAIVFFGIGLVVLMVCIIQFVNKPIIIKYLITNQKIQIAGERSHITTYQNIKNVSMRKYRNKSSCGVIQIHVRKGLSLNFRLVHVPDVENVYKLIMDNIANASSGQ